MPGRLAFGHVERMAERAQKLGKPDLLQACDFGARDGHGVIPGSLTVSAQGNHSELKIAFRRR